MLTVSRRRAITIQRARLHCLFYNCPMLLPTFPERMYEVCPFLIIRNLSPITMTSRSGPAMTSAGFLSTFGSREQNPTTSYQTSCSKALWHLQQFLMAYHLVILRVLSTLSLPAARTQRSWPEKKQGAALTWDTPTCLHSSSHFSSTHTPLATLPHISAPCSTCSAPCYLRFILTLHRPLPHLSELPSHLLFIQLFAFSRVKAINAQQPHNWSCSSSCGILMIWIKTD